MLILPKLIPINSEIQETTGLCSVGYVLHHTVPICKQTICFTIQKGNWEFFK